MRGWILHGRFLRSKNVWLQNGTIPGNRLRMLNRQIASAGNAVQSSETMRDSLGLN